MAARASMFLILGATTVAAAGAMYFVPEVSASADEVHTAALAPAPNQSAVAPIKVAAAQQTAVNDANCAVQAWPYLSAACDTDGSARAARARQVRIISTDRDAPRAVPLPASTVAPAESEPALTPASGDIVTVLPPARPAGLDNVQAADASAASAVDVDVTGSVKPAVAAPARRRVARSSAPVIRSDDGDVAPLQVVTYRDAYGRDVIVRSAPSEGRRQVFADDGMDRQPRYDRPARNANPLAWLTGSQF